MEFEFATYIDNFQWKQNWKLPRLLQLLCLKNQTDIFCYLL